MIDQYRLTDILKPLILHVDGFKSYCHKAVYLYNHHMPVTNIERRYIPQIDITDPIDQHYYTFELELSNNLQYIKVTQYEGHYTYLPLYNIPIRSLIPQKELIKMGIINQARSARKRKQAAKPKKRTAKKPVKSKVHSSKKTTRTKRTRKSYKTRSRKARK